MLSQIRRPPQPSPSRYCPSAVALLAQYGFHIFELVRMLVRFNHVANGIANPNDRVIILQENHRRIPREVSCALTPTTL